MLMPMKGVLTINTAQSSRLSLEPIYCQPYIFSLVGHRGGFF